MKGPERIETSRLVLDRLSRDFGTPMAEISRHVGVSASAVVKSIQRENRDVNNSQNSARSRVPSQWIPLR